MRRTLAVALATALVAGAAGTARSARPLRTAVFEPSLATGADLTTELERIHGSGSSLIRIAVHWSAIAPQDPAKGFAATDPRDAQYTWTAIDEVVSGARANGLDPILDIVAPPAWALSSAGEGTGYPEPARLGAFATAIATHFNGKTAGTPRVKYWQLWNEPNLSTNIGPQFRGSAPASPGIYRSMVNAFADAIKRVSPSNTVIVGALAPYGITSPDQEIDSLQSVAPMRFLRGLLCVSEGAQPKPTCKTRVRFDVLTVHPYTWGGPTHSAFSSDDLAIGDLPEAKALLAQAWSLRRITAGAAPELWVTEFSWDTNPPDPAALDLTTQARWASEALYRMWRSGVSVVTWFLLRDIPIEIAPFQSGLYFTGSSISADSPKPTLTAFRFPFVAFAETRGAHIWGRRPDSLAGVVRIDRKTESGWRQVAMLQADRYGIFESTLAPAAIGGSDLLRARIGGPSGGLSLPFSLTPVADVRISPFGS